MVERNTFQYLAVAPLFLLAAYAFYGMFGGGVVFEQTLHIQSGISMGFELRPGVLYQAQIRSGCFYGTDYRASLSLRTVATGEVVASHRGNLTERNSRVGCHDHIYTAEFEVSRGADYEVVWEVSDEVLTHTPFIRVETLPMPIYTSLTYECIGLFGGLGVWVGVGWLYDRRYPPSADTESEELELEFV